MSAGINPLPRTDSFREIERWRQQLKDFSVNIPWNNLNFANSNLTDIETRNHNDLQSLDAADFQHLTQAEHDGLVNGLETALHTHSHLNLNDIGTNTHAQIDTFIAENEDARLWAFILGGSN